MEKLNDILKEKLPGNFTKCVLFLHENDPAHRPLKTRRNWPTWASSTFIFHFILRIWPVGIPTVPWSEKKWISPFFFLR